MINIIRGEATQQIDFVQSYVLFLTRYTLMEICTVKFPGVLKRDVGGCQPPTPLKTRYLEATSFIRNFVHLTKIV